jgi:hypothetical protein
MYVPSATDEFHYASRWKGFKLANIWQYMNSKSPGMQPRMEKRFVNPQTTNFSQV